MIDKNTLQENDIVICKVTKVEGTTVFLEIENPQGPIQGSMIFSEVSPGRIRNIREYVVPNKRIVCKILRISGTHIELSLRRVTGKEREETLERDKKEKTIRLILKPVLENKTSETLNKISKEYELADFLDEVRENPKLIDKFVTLTQSKKLQKIFSEKREKDKEIKKTIIVNSFSESGLYDIQKVLETKEPNLEIQYKGSSKFSIKIKAKDFKTANHNLEEVLKEMKEKAKKLNVQLEIK